MESVLKVTYLFFLLAINMNSQEINSIIEYQGNLENIDIEKKLKTVPKEFHDKIRETYADVKPVDFILKVKDYESIFQQIESLNIENEPLNLANIRGEKGLFYINTKTKETLREKEVMGDIYSVSYSLDSIHWDLKKDKKKIGSYVCYKAVTKRKKITLKGTVIQNIVAWYTLDIPISHGPIGYGGLPGLILELHTGDYVYYTKRISLKLKKELFFQKPDNGIAVTQQEFYIIESDITNGILDMKRK